MSTTPKPTEPPVDLTRRSFLGNGLGAIATAVVSRNLVGCGDDAGAPTDGGSRTVDTAGAVDGGVLDAREGLDAHTTVRGWPSWRRAMAPNTWAEIPTSNVLADLDPATLGIIPAGANWVGTGGMTAGAMAWTGGVWDDASQTFYFPTVGGHTDYGGNEPHRIRLGDENPTFVKVRRPSGAIGMPSVDAADGTQPTCLYSDGRIRPGHSYHNQCFVPGLGPLITRISGAFRDGTNSTDNVMHPGVRVARWLDADGESHVLCDYNSVPGQGSGSVDDGGAAFDPTRGSRGTVWTVGSGTSRLVGIDVATGVATGRGESDNHIPSGGALLYVPGLDVLAYFGGALFRIMRLDMGATTTVSPTVTGDYSDGFQWLTFDGAAVEWCAERGVFLLWNNLKNRAEISTLTPSDPRDPSAPWVRGVLPVDGANDVIPPLLGSNGATPFGRGRYSSSLSGFVLFGGTTTRPHFFAIG